MDSNKLNFNLVLIQFKIICLNLRLVFSSFDPTFTSKIKSTEHEKVVLCLLRYRKQSLSPLLPEPLKIVLGRPLTHCYTAVTHLRKEFTALDLHFMDSRSVKSEDPFLIGLVGTRLGLWLRDRQSLVTEASIGHVLLYD